MREIRVVIVGVSVVDVGVRSLPQPTGLGLRQYHRQALRLLGPLDVVQPRQFLRQYLAIQKQDCAFGLILRRCGDLPFDREMRQKRLNLGGPKVTRMTLVKMHDETFNPIDIGLFRANAVMLDANLGADLVEELGLSGRRSHGNLGWMKNVQLINTKC